MTYRNCSWTPAGTSESDTRRKMAEDLGAELAAVPQPDHQLFEQNGQASGLLEQQPGQRFRARSAQ